MGDRLQAFYYQAWHAQGDMLKGTVYATHRLLARQQVQAQGLVIKTLRRRFFAKNLTFNATAQLHFLEQLTVLLQAQLPLTFCLQLLQAQFSPMVRQIIQHLQQSIHNGASFAQALQQYPMLFPRYLSQLVHVGETSGQLVSVLQHITHYQQAQLALKNKIKKSLFYPVFILCLSVLMTLGLLLWVVPQFQTLFAEFSGDLPLMTQLVFAVSTQLQAVHGLTFLCGIIGSTIMLQGLKRQAFMRSLWQRGLYGLPWVGSVLQQHQQIRYCQSLSVALTADLPLSPALTLVQHVVADTPLAPHTQGIGQRVAQGEPLWQSLQKTSQFAPLVIQLVQTGEQTGQLGPLLAQGAQVLEAQLQQNLHRFTVLLQPLFMLLLGLLLGGLMIALYLPVFNLGVLY